MVAGTHGDIGYSREVVAVRLALAGDTMLGRRVAERIRRSDEPLFAEEVMDAARSADLFLLNLECCISDRGERWPARGKPFFFRAPAAAVEQLITLGVDAVTLANNHALDYGAVALRDTLDHLHGAGIAVAGAGPDRLAARRPLRLTAAGCTVDVIAVADHPADFAAEPNRPGIAYADLRRGTPVWLLDTVSGATADVVVVTPHWGPNMTVEPPAHVREAATVLTTAGATLVAGHSAHVFHGIGTESDPTRVICYDLGDFIDDYAVDPELRNDLGLLWLIDFDGARPVRLEAVPLALDYCYTRLAVGQDREWIARRLMEASAVLGTAVQEESGRLVVTL